MVLHSYGILDKILLMLVRKQQRVMQMRMELVHFTIHLHTRAERLAGLLLHFPAKSWVLNDILFFKLEIILTHDGPDAFAPAAESFQISSDLRFLVAHALTIPLSAHLATIHRRLEFRRESDLPAPPQEFLFLSVLASLHLAKADFSRELH